MVTNTLYTPLPPEGPEAHKLYKPRFCVGAIVGFRDDIGDNKYPCGIIVSIDKECIAFIWLDTFSLLRYRNYWAKSDDYYERYFKKLTKHNV